MAPATPPSTPRPASRLTRLPAALVALLAGLALSVGVAACGGSQISSDEVAAPPPELTVPTEGDPEGADPLAEAESGGASTQGSGDDDAADSDSGDTSTSSDGTDGATGTSGSDASGGTTGSTGSGGASAPSTGGAAPATPQATATPAPAAPQEDSAANDTAPQPGSGAEKFEEFCQQNAGAC